MTNLLENIGLKLLWFDSLGAKSASIYIEAKENSIIIDPGAAAMQPSYPLPSEKKRELRRRALKTIEEYCWKAKVIIITHYHYDHHVRLNDPDIIDPRKMFLERKTLILKNPNKYINESQWHRAREFITGLLRLSGADIKEYLVEPEEEYFQDPVEEFIHAFSKDYGSYSNRRKELLNKGRKWFNKLAREIWSKEPWIKDGIVLDNNTRITWGDGKEFEVGGIIIKIFDPWFHGIEYDRTGWVIPVLIVKNNYRILYTSDIMGPQIEDYAYKIIDLRPDILIADGPPTYLYPYMLNKINLNRAIENMIRIIEEGNIKLIIYDHHLLREKRWRERIQKVLKTARDKGVPLLTAAEYMGLKPLIDTL